MLQRFKTALKSLSFCTFLEVDVNLGGVAFSIIMYYEVSNLFNMLILVIMIHQYLLIKLKKDKRT